MLALPKLLRLQAVFAAMAIGFLIASGIRASWVGAPLSAADVPSSITLFVRYSACLFLPRYGEIGWYRIAMIPALVAFGGGGVIGNVVNFSQNGLASYASLPVFFVAIAINAFGSVLNIAAALGLFRK
ncbi:hypothetical protein AVO45_18575 [Ruegeria marisrubri]|uniref:Uncharacterized protein n=1 Tax=Ruegeria marisrubri TaxID=1685379 RepID=A0A0X3U5L6_9RHOB|nr:hypothetical protein [Ruegeria marisrubri]KUJ83189.1 hypothetical protein AVO45_18575 [Ruegeria marisrubri]